MVGKMVGIVVTIMYILDGSIKTMQSTWAGPPGQLVKAIGSCFHPTTEITLSNGDKHEMQNLPLGSELMGGGKVFAILKVDNTKKEPLYKIKGTHGNKDILVSGEHFVLDKQTNKWIQVNKYSKAIILKNKIPEHFSCIITTNRRIPINDEIFWDWEDDELTK